MLNSFFKGTLVLTVGAIIVKGAGMLNWMILWRVLGGEGVGLYQLAFPVYNLALTISSAGIPVAISIVTAEKLAKNDFLGAARVFRISFITLAASGLIAAILLFFGSSLLIDYHIVRDARAYESLIALAPAVFFATMLTSFRGYFQGWQMMMPTAVSQIVEQIARIVTMLFFASLLLPRGLEHAAAGASLGAFPGAVCGLFVLLYYYFRLKRNFKNYLPQQAAVRPEPDRRIVKRIFALAIPVSLASIMVPVVSNIDLFIVPYRLEAAGFSVAQATELFGYLNGMAIQLVNMATILTASLAISIVPAVSEAAALDNHQAIQWRVAGAMRLVNLITVPGFVILSLLAAPVCYILYGTTQAFVPVEVLSVGVIFLGIHQVSTSVLQGLGRTAIPVINMTIAALIKIAINWTLTALPTLGIAGASWATVADFGVAALLNMFFVHRYTGFSLNIKETAKFIAAGSCMAAVILVVTRVVLPQHMVISAMVAGLTGIAAYCAVLLATGGLVERDIKRMPVFGEKAAGFLRSRGWVKS